MKKNEKKQTRVVSYFCKNWEAFNTLLTTTTKFNIFPTKISSQLNTYKILII